MKVAPNLPETLVGPRRATDAGFTIVEAMVAASILLMVIAGFGSTLNSSLTGSRDNDRSQEATAIALERLEIVRSDSWSEVAMASVDAEAPAVDAAEGILVGSAVDLAYDEPLVVDEAAGVVDPVLVESVDGTSYTIWQIVSETDDGHRRFLVIVEWVFEGDVSQHRNSTLITEASAS